MYRFYLDSSPIEEPKGWDKLVTTIKRDRAFRAMLITQDAQFEFTGDGYDYLYSVHTSGYCNEVDVLIEETLDGGDTWLHFYNGVIKIPAISFDEKNRIASCQVDDNSYFARINSAKNIGCNITGSKSRNGIDITPIPLSSIKYFDVSTGTYITQTLTGGYEGGAYKVYDCLRFMVDWMSDGELSFASDTFGAGGDYEDYFITIGRAIELYDQTVPNGFTYNLWRQFFPKVSFDVMYRELSRRFNLRLIIDNSNTSPTVRIEQESYFTQAGTMLTAQNVDRIVTKTNADYIYNKVSYGSSGQEDDLGGTDFPASIDYKGFKTEEFAIIGPCSTDNPLDLACSWITSSNFIQYCVDNGTSGTADYDSLVFLVHATLDSGSNYFAVKSDFLGIGKYFYNESLTNESISDRFLGAVPNSIVNYFGTSNFFKAKRNANLASLLAPLVSNEPVQFDDDYTTPYYDNNNNYGNGTIPPAPISAANSRYTAPLSGIFKFVVYIERIEPGAGNITVVIRVYDNTNTLKTFSADTQSFPLGVNLDNYFYPASVYMDATTGDYAQVDITFGNNCAPDDVNGIMTWECVLAGADGFIKTYDPEDYPIIQHEFKYPITASEFNDIKSNPCRYIEFSMEGQQVRRGQLESIKYEHKSGIATILLNSSKTMNN